MCIGCHYIFKDMGHHGHVEAMESDRGIIVGRVFSPTRRLVRISHPNICLSFQILNLSKILSSWGSSKLQAICDFTL